MKQGKILYGGLRSLNRELATDNWRRTRYTVLLDENSFQHCLPLLVSNVEALQEAEFIEVPAGEECKSIEVAAQVWQSLLDGAADRQSVIVNLGGGSVCDLGGFVAAAYKRGIRHINIPTTLLAMTDAAIGGKTAIDFGGVKNSIGLFYPSAITVIEPAFLDTLPPSELLCGQIEMLKTAAVTDAELYSQMLLLSILNKEQIVKVARIKSRIVRFDPYDHTIRRILNFGHTFGHALEVYSSLPHGLAVGAGMSVAMYLSVHKLGFPEQEYQRYRNWINQRMQLSRYSLRDIEQLLSLMHQDKKNADGELRCVLLQELGVPVIDVSVSDNEVRDAFLHLTR